MFKGVAIGQYYPGDSFFHCLEPRIKIGLITIYVISLFLLDSFWGYLIMTVFTLTVIIASRLPFKLMLRGLKPLYFILAFTLLLHIFFTKGGTVLFQWKKISIESAGIISGLMMAWRLILLVMTSSLLTLTTSPIALTDAIEGLLSPLKPIGVPAHELAMMMTIALRFIPTLLEEAEKIMKAQMARGADFESGNLIQRAKSMIPLLVPLFISSFRRADDLALAMEARCYRGGKGRTRMKVHKVTGKDWLTLGGFVGTMAVLVWLGI
ncbi:MAG: energy-coupling factor transporter transmembrane component T [Eubacteriales bacterium]|nr:energy-coupling factor transporter transmembrane component T [Eubacteriales bacterium]MDD3072840.1 energy-coupling factor transporter transmembrane component T [Eubacteriales bacterium]MDD4079168.1 energy-coupling factor transporter transmembrane component T [Eubacteriales bacterium]MDD4768203.1 energy-coupling factor transporter transmembrane component T [Eubacteriales bacterium]